MIARTWHGVVPESKSDEYLEYLQKTGVPDSNSTAGNKGVFVLRRNEDGKTHFWFISLWESGGAIRKFAGEDIEKARYYPEDKDYLFELEPNVTHYEVAVHQESSS
jgi:heme-degrading monooxygenase HmoA